MIKVYKGFKVVAVALSLILASGGLSACVPTKQEEAKSDSKITKNFAEYIEDDVKFSPGVLDYQVADDFSNVIDIERYNLQGELKQMLKDNHFAVSDEIVYDHFFQIYEHNRYEQIPSFITVDSVLNAFHNQFDFLLQSAEIQKLYADLLDMTERLYAAAEKDYAKLKGTNFDSAAKRNLAYMSVAATLLDLTKDGKVKINSDVKGLVDEELKLINGANGIAKSPLMNLTSPKNEYLEDYSQYKPRGHYTDEDYPKLRKYFKAMMWYGRISFRLSEDDEVKSSILTAYALSNKETQAKWKNIYDTSAFFAGQSDSLSPLDYYDEISSIAGADIDYAKLDKLSKANIEKFAKNMLKRNHAKINTMPIYDESIEPDRDAATVGCRIMGQRYSLDADVFQRLVYREVGEDGNGARRMLPQVLDLTAAFGSQDSEKILEENGNFKFKNYKENLAVLQKKIAKLDKEQWTTDLYQAWLYNLKPLTDDSTLAKGYPMFMRNIAWVRKNLNSFIGSYTELKHDTILYSAQIMAEMGGAGDDIEYDDRGYVEPAPVLYARLSALSNMMKQGLKNRQLLSKDAEKNLDILNKMCKTLKDISVKELENKELSEKDYDFIKEFGGNLEHLWYSTFPDDKLSASLAYENPSMLVADIASSPDSVLTEATGALRRISVLVPIGDKLQLTQGLVYATHEFVVKPSERMTDQEWIDVVRSQEYDSVPNHPWIYSFYNESNSLNVVYDEDE